MYIFIDRLNVSSFLYLIIKTYGMNVNSIYVFEGNHYILNLLKFLKPRTKIKIINYYLGDLQSSDRISIKNNVKKDVYDIIVKYQEGLQTDSIFHKLYKFKFTPTSWPIRYMGHKASEQCIEHIRNIYLFEFYSKSINSDQKLYLLKDSQFKPFIDINFFNSNLHKFHYHSKSTGLCIEILCVSGLTFLLLVKSLRFLFSPIKIENKTGGVAVQYCWGHNPNSRNDLFWLKGSGIDPNRIILYFDRPDSPLTDNLRKELESLGISRLVVLTGKIRRISPKEFLFPAKLLTKWFSQKKQSHKWIPTANFSKNVWNRFVIFFKHFLKFLFFSNKTFSTKIFLVSCVIRMIYEVSYWENFYESFHVKAHTNHSGDCGAIHTAQSIALSQVEAINFRSNYSYVSGYEINYSREFHLYFLWGKNAKCIKENEILYNILNIVAGYPFDYLFSKKEPKTDTSIKTICVFDEDYGKFCSYGLSTFISFYSFLSSLLQKDPRFTLSIKSKSYSKNFILSKFPHLKYFFQENRLFFYEPNRYSPCQAAFTSDFVIGLGYNSAGIEAALMGKPLILWIHDNLVCPQLQDLPDIHICTSLSSLENKIFDFANKNIYASSLKPNAYDDIDPFRDGQASTRIGCTLNYFLQLVDNGTFFLKALDNTEIYYAQNFGKDMVFRGNPDLLP